MSPKFFDLPTRQHPPAANRRAEDVASLFCFNSGILMQFALHTKKPRVNCLLHAKNHASGNDRREFCSGSTGQHTQTVGAQQSHQHLAPNSHISSWRRTCRSPPCAATRLPDMCGWSERESCMRHWCERVGEKFIPTVKTQDNQT